MDKEQKVERVTQEIIGKHVANNKELWDAFLKGAKECEQSIFKESNIQNKDFLTDVINKTDWLKSILKNLFKGILLKHEFLVTVGGTNILTNYRLFICGESNISIPLKRITKYGLEGDHFVVKYMRNGKERSINLKEYLLETIVNPFLDAEEALSLNEVQMNLIENSNSLRKKYDIPKYTIPPKSQKTKMKEEKITSTRKRSSIIYKILSLVPLFFMWYSLIYIDWFHLSGESIPDQLWPRSMIFIIVHILALIWIVNIFTPKPIIGAKFVGSWVVILILQVIWPIVLHYNMSKINSYITSSIQPGYYINLGCTIIFLVLTGFYLAKQDI